LPTDLPTLLLRSKIDVVLSPAAVGQNGQVAEARAPLGDRTLLFTDIEGSTALAERLGDRWPKLLAEHNRIVRDSVSAHGGIELGAEGDALFVAFTSAGAAAAAAAAQKALASHPWPEDAAVRVRMGLSGR
jgi:class 3 adenylate cyclase